MAGATALHVAVLLAALAATASASATPLLSQNDVFGACSFVTVPALCTSIITRTSVTTLHDLTLAALNEAATTAANARDMVENAQAEAAGDLKIKSCLDVCSKGFGLAVDSLQQAARDAGAGKAYSSAVSNVSSAVNHVGSCNDVFSESPGLASPVADITNILKKLVSNSLALSMALEVQARNGTENSI